MSNNNENYLPLIPVHHPIPAFTYCRGQPAERCERLVYWFFANFMAPEKKSRGWRSKRTNPQVHVFSPIHEPSARLGRLGSILQKDIQTIFFRLPINCCKIRSWDSDWTSSVWRSEHLHIACTDIQFVVIGDLGDTLSAVWLHLVEIISTLTLWLVLKKSQITQSFV
jgi:hypothetical protein